MYMYMYMYMQLRSGVASSVFVLRQGPEHPHPGERYATQGFPRIGFLPNNASGRKVT